MFKRRDRRPLWQAMFQALWPKGGWVRAFEYVKHRVRRLPDPPHRIARGIFAGVLVSFTPFFGLHFLMAAGLARLMRGNILASLLATFFANPLTYLPIAYVSLKSGHYLLGGSLDHGVPKTLLQQFGDAWMDLRHNAMAVFTDERADWSNLGQFWDEVFLPYLIGGILPGLFCALVLYYVSVPVITAYKNRNNKGAITSKLAKLRPKAIKKPAPPDTDDT